MKGDFKVQNFLRHLVLAFRTIECTVKESFHKGRGLNDALSSLQMNNTQELSGVLCSAAVEPLSNPALLVGSTAAAAVNNSHAVRRQRAISSWNAMSVDAEAQRLSY